MALFEHIIIEVVNRRRLVVIQLEWNDLQIC